MTNEFEKYIKMQRDSANRHRGHVLEHDGYVLPSEDKFFACTYDLVWNNGLTVISIPFDELDQYELVGGLGSSYMPLVRFKNVAV